MHIAHTKCSRALKKKQFSFFSSRSCERTNKTTHTHTHRGTSERVRTKTAAVRLFVVIWFFNNINDDRVEFMGKQKQKKNEVQIYVVDALICIECTRVFIFIKSSLFAMGFAAQHALIHPESINKSKIHDGDDIVITNAPRIMTSKWARFWLHLMLCALYRHIEKWLWVCVCVWAYECDGRDVCVYVRRIQNLFLYNSTTIFLSFRRKSRLQPLQLWMTLVLAMSTQALQCFC